MKLILRHTGRTNLCPIAHHFKGKLTATFPLIPGSRVNETPSHWSSFASSTSGRSPGALLWLPKWQNKQVCDDLVDNFISNLAKSKRKVKTIKKGRVFNNLTETQVWDYLIMELQWQLPDRMKSMGCVGLHAGLIKCCSLSSIQWPVNPH